jgi:anionic cell wall polymer biosynthesis LytR-Cps2A-Psr (LCP) family protein
MNFPTKITEKIKLISNKKKISLIVAISLTLIISTSATFFFFKNSTQDNNQESNPEVLGGFSETTFVVPEEQPEDVNTLNILLLGYGGAGHQGGMLTDVIQIVHFNFETGKIALISIPRDLWVALPNGKSDKINAAYVLDYKTATHAKTMAQIATGLKIDHYIAMDFVGFKRTIGYQLNGLEVNVPETLQDDWYPIEGEQLNPCGMTPEEVGAVTAQYSGFSLEKQFPCRYQKLLFQKGLNKMEGEEVLQYVRSRHSSSDFARSERQVAVLKAIKDKIFSLDSFSNLPKYFKQISKHAHSDIDLEIAKYLSPAIKGSKDYEISSITLSTENVFKNARSNTGQYILIPKAGMGNWDKIHNFISGKL